MSCALPGYSKHGNVEGHLDECDFAISKLTASFRSFFIPLIITLPFENVPIYSFKKKLIWPIISCGLRKGSKEGTESLTLISLIKSRTWF